MCAVDTTGTHSIYTEYADWAQVMYHVSTLLPYTSTNKQQLQRKRHIGNDIVTVVFQEANAAPFLCTSVRSNFQKVFIVVRALTSPGTLTGTGSQRQTASYRCASYRTPSYRCGYSTWIDWCRTNLTSYYRSETLIPIFYLLTCSWIFFYFCTHKIVSLY